MTATYYLRFTRTYIIKDVLYMWNWHTFFFNF